MSLQQDKVNPMVNEEEMKGEAAMLLEAFDAGELEWALGESERTASVLADFWADWKCADGTEPEELTPRVMEAIEATFRGLGLP